MNEYNLLLHFNMRETLKACVRMQNMRVKVLLIL
jgi:hypothetical protein